MAVLSDDDKALVSKLQRDIRANRKRYTLLDRYYEGERRLEQIGIAVPPELQIFRAAVNVPRMAVDEPVSRQNLKGFQRSNTSDSADSTAAAKPDKASIDPALQDAWDYNKLTSRSGLVHLDARLYGRAFVSVSTNPNDDAMPLIVPESPEGMGVDVSPLGVLRAAFREYKDGTERRATLYKPESTRWLKMGRNGWEDIDDDNGPDEHNLGRLPLVMFLNRQRTARFAGVSEMADVIEKTDAIARLITNMQVAGEALAWPKRWAAGVSRGDFVDKDGKPLPIWEAYMTVIMTAANKDAKFGNFDAAELANFHKAVDALLSWCAAELGLPLRFMGQEATNPASEGAIKADESRLVKNVELKNRFDGDSWSDVMSLWERFRTGEDSSKSVFRALWFDPSTPTQAEITDQVLKLKSQGIISREGAWDIMGWDEARKARERAYFDQEAAADPLVKIAAAVNA